MHSAPAWSQYASDETYWSLIDTLKTIGDKYGRWKDVYLFLLINVLNENLIVVFLQNHKQRYYYLVYFVLGKSIPQVALRWLVQQDVVASVIIGATSVKQLEDNMGAGKGWALTDDEVSVK